MSGKPKDKLTQIADVISEMTGRHYPPYSLISTPFAFLGDRRMFRTKGDATAAKKRADTLSKKARALEIALDKLPAEQEDFIFQWACGCLPPGPSTFEGVPHLTFRDLLGALKAGANMEAERIEDEIKKIWQKSTRQPNIRAQDVANTIAEIFVRETCRYPTSGHNNEVPAGDFCIAVDAVFTILGITTGFRSPSERAAKEIKQKVDLEAARRDLARRDLYRREIGKRKAGSAPKSLIS